MKQCVLAFGGLWIECVDSLIANYKDYTDKFVSVMANNNPDTIQLLRDNGFTVIESEQPTENPLPERSTLITKGIQHIKSLGVYTHVLVIQIDVNINSPTALLDRYATYDETKPTFIAWCKNRANEPAYLIGNIVYGTLDTIEQYYNKFHGEGEQRFDELFYQENFFEGEKPLQYADVRNKINLSLEDLYANNIEIYTTHPELTKQGNLLKGYKEAPWRIVGSVANEFVDFESTPSE